MRAWRKTDCWQGPGQCRQDNDCQEDHERGCEQRQPHDALTKVSRVEAFASSPIFRRRHPTAGPVHQLLDIVRWIATTVRFEVDTTIIIAAVSRLLSRYVACFYPDVFALSLRHCFWVEWGIPVLCLRTLLVRARNRFRRLWFWLERGTPAVVPVGRACNSCGTPVVVPVGRVCNSFRRRGWILLLRDSMGAI